MNSKSEITNFLPLPKDDWLSKWNEIIIDPHIPIVDAHHHIWSRPSCVYGAEELTKDLISGHLITSTVFVQCREHYYQFGDEAFKPIRETEYIVQTANEAEELIKNNTAKNFNHKIKICEAIVGFADLTLGDRVAAVLEAHISASNHRFRGIRHSGARYEDGPITNTWPLPPNSLFLESNFIKGFAVLNKFNLSFDAWVYQNQLLNVYRFGIISICAFMTLRPHSRTFYQHATCAPHQIEFQLQPLLCIGLKQLCTHSIHAVSQSSLQTTHRLPL